MAPAPNDLQSDWIGSGEGDWSTTADWSQGVPSAAGTSAVIGNSVTTDVTIGPAESFSPDSVTLDNYYGTLDLAGTLATTNGVTIQAGTLDNSGSLSGPVALDSGGVLVEIGSSPFTLDNAIGLDGGTITWFDTVTGTASVTVPTGTVIVGAGAIDDATYLQPGYVPGTVAPKALPVLLTNLGTIQTSSSVTNGPAIYLSFDNQGLTNDGLIEADGGSVFIAGDTLDNAAGATLEGLAGFNLSINSQFTNEGLITETGGQLQLGGIGTWTNTGSIIANNATVLLGGNETQADIGALTRTGTTSLELSGILQNAGTTLDATDTLLQGLTLQGGTIVGGTLDPTAFGLVLGANQDSGLEGVTVINGLTVGAGNVTLTNGTTVYSDDAQTLATITVGTGGTLGFAGTKAYTIGQDVTEDGGAVVLSGPFTLDSTITGTGGLIALGNQFNSTPTTWVNDGLVQLTGGTLELDGNETVAQLGSITDTGATVIFTGGTLNNAGGTLNGSSTALLGLQLEGGTVEGGTLDAAALGLGFGQYYYTGNDLDNVTVINGLTIGSGSVTLSGTTEVFADAAATKVATVDVDNTGSLTFAGTADYTINQDISLSSGSFGEAFVVANGPFTLDSTITVSTGGTLELNPYNFGTTAPPTWVNNGLISLTGGVLELGGDETVAQIGSIANSGGTIEFVSGELDNTGATLNASDTSLLGLRLQGGTIEGGTLDAASFDFSLGNQYDYGYLASDLDNVAIINNLTVSGPVALSGTSEVFSDATATKAGTIAVQSGGEVGFIGAGPFTLENAVSLNGGEVTWAASNTSAPAGTTVDATIAAATVISGYGTVGLSNDNSTVDLTNLGTIDANQSFQTLTVGAASLTNKGLIETSGTSATVQLGTVISVYDTITQTYDLIASTLVNDGTIAVNGGSLSIVADATAAQLGTIDNTGGKIFYRGGTLDNIGGTLNGSDTSLLGLQLAGGTIEGGTLDTTGLGFGVSNYYAYNSGSDLDNVTVINGLTIDGQLYLTGSTTVYADASATTLGTITANSASELVYLGNGPFTLDNPIVMTNANVDWTTGTTYVSNAPTVDVTLAAGDGVIGSGIFAGGLNNTDVDLTILGTIDATGGGFQTLSVDATTMLNKGLLEASSASPLVLGTLVSAYDPITQTYTTTASTLLNDGVIEANGGSIYLQVDATVAQLGSIVNNGGTIFYRGGTLDNMGGTLNASDTSLLGVQFDGGAIEGGTLDTTGLGFGVASYYSQPSDLDNVTVINGLTVQGTVALTGTTKVFADSKADSPGTIAASGYNGAVEFIGAGPFTLDNPVTLTGGSLIWSAHTAYSSTISTIDVTVAATELVSGYGNVARSLNSDIVDLTNLGTIDAISQWLTVSAASLVNKGLMEVTSGQLQLGTVTSQYNPTTQSYDRIASTITNTGTIALSSGGLLFLDVDATVAQLGSITNAGGTIYYQGGTLDNTGGTLGSADTTLLGLQLDGGTIEGGTLDAKGLGFAVGNYSPSGDSDLDNVAVLNNLTVSSRLDITGSTSIYADGSAATPGTIDIAGYAAGVTFIGAGPFTLDNAVTMTGGFLSWSPGTTSGTSEPVAVTIAAATEVSGYGYIEDNFDSSSGDDLTNLGTIAADQNFGYLQVDTTEFDNKGTLLAQNGGTLQVSSTTFDNLSNGTLTGGTYISDANSGVVFNTNQSVTTDNADIVLTGNGAYNSVESTLTDVATGATLEVDNSANFNNSNNTPTLAVDGLVTLGGGTLTETALAIDAGGTLSGFGVVNASSGQTSAGLVEASGGLLVLNGSITDGETVDIADFATLELGSTSNAVVHMGNNTTLVLDNSGSLFSGTIDGFGVGDAIVLNGFAATGAEFNSDTLTIASSSGSITLNLPGLFGANGFQTFLATTTQTVITLGNSGSLAISAPSSLLDNPGTVIAVPGTITDGVSAQVTVDVIAQHGVLAATADAADGGVVQGNGTGSLVMSGDLTAINAELGSLEYRAPAGNGVLTDIIAIDAVDNASGITSTLVNVTINQPPTIALPGSITAQDTAVTAVTGLSVSDPDNIAGEIYTITVSDTAGTLDVGAVTGVTVSGNDSNAITLTGTIDAVNTDLASLTFTGSLNDSLTVTANDSRGGVVEGFVPVLVNLPPAINAPGTVQGLVGTAVAVHNVDILDAFGASQGDTFTASLIAGLGNLEVTPVAGASVTGNDSGTLTLTGSLAAVNAELGSLQYVGPGSIYPSDTISIGVDDGKGGTDSDSVLVIPPPPPTVTLPSKFIVGGGLETPLDGVSVAVGAGLAGDTMITLDLSDSVGTLGVKLTDGITVGGNGSTDLELIGEAGALNTALSSLIYTGGTSLDTSTTLDSISVTASEDDASANKAVPVLLPQNHDNPSQPQSFAMLILDSGLLAYLQYDNGDNAYVGTLYADLPAYYNNQPPPTSGFITFSVLNDNVVTATDNASVFQEPYAPVVGDWTTTGPFSAGGMTGFFSTGQVITATDHTLKQPDTITYIFKSTASDAGQLPDRRLTIVFNKTTSVTTPTTPTSPTSTTPTPPPPTPTPTPTTPHSHGQHGGGKGDVHLTTYDGLYYDFQAAGEFTLVKSTQQGDTFNVQIRLQPWHDSATVSVVTEAAVGIGTHRITFAIDRTATVWEDGKPLTLTTGGTPIDLGAGTLQQLSSTVWQILYDSGETVRISNLGTFLDVETAIPSNTPSGGVEGLLGTDSGNPANDLVANGTVLPQPLSSAQLYTTFADAWRITNVSDSLLDYGTGQSPATFNDPNFPSDQIALGNIPANILENAQTLIANAGIKNSAAAQSALEDYLLTGNQSFITAETGSGSNSNVTSVLPNPTTTATASLGIAAIEPTVTVASTGTTAVSFEIYDTGTVSVAQTVTYTVSAPGLDISIPGTGVATIAAGDTMTTLDFNVTGSLATPTGTVDVQISNSDTSTPVIAATANVIVDNDKPVAGPKPIPVFIDASNFGTLTSNEAGTEFTLDVGTIVQHSTVTPFLIDLANDATLGADTLFGNVTATGSMVVFGNGLPPAVNLTPGAVYQIVSEIDTGTLGTIDRTITFDANDKNASGYSANLGTITLDITGEIAAVACFAAGTAIRTPHGQVAVEDLCIGDTVLTAQGDVRPIVWIGHRDLDCRRHPKPEQVWPVHVAANAFGPGLPRRALVLSPDHAVYARGVLIPVKCLINGTTIVQRKARKVHYFHVELDRHDILLANDLPAESYLDTGDRAKFENSGLPLILHPDFSTRVWEAAACAPLTIVGPEVDAVRRTLKAQARKLAMRKKAA